MCCFSGREEEEGSGEERERKTNLMAPLSQEGPRRDKGKIIGKLEKWREIIFKNSHIQKLKLIYLIYLLAVNMYLYLFIA